MQSHDDLCVCLIGHPFSPIGRGEDVRSIYSALREVNISPIVIDVFSHQEPEPSKLHQEIKRSLSKDFGKINIFIINGDEVSAVLKRLNLDTLPAGLNIAYPAWELSNYPDEWSNLLNKFDEVWAQSKFTFNALSKSISRPVRHIPLPSESRLETFLSRQYFKIPEESFAFLFSFDFRSYISRKNPFSIINSFKKLINEKTENFPMLIVKVHGKAQSQKIKQQFQDAIGDLGNNVILIDTSLTDVEMRNLIRVCDCYVSLHRSEGFGRGMAEAMSMGRPVIATGYSGNLDFMDNSNSLLVDCEMVAVGDREYPHGEGQEWASPDEMQAFNYMKNILTCQQIYEGLSMRSRVSIRKTVGYKSVGLKMKNAFKELSGIKHL
jgi:glycosyltransferase involved in cell wall biosynthesis